MGLTRDLFDERRDEISSYIDFVSKLDSIETYRKSTIDFENGCSFILTRDLQKIFRSYLFILTYNLIESTIHNCLTEICDKIHDESLPYDCLSPKLQEYWRSCQLNFITRSSINLQKSKRKFEQVIQILENNESVDLTLIKPTISGNLDYRAIDKIINVFGFYGKLEIDDLRKLKQALLLFKNKRNQLAHGNISFTKASENLTIGELINMINSITQYMDQVIMNLDNFINEKRYKSEA